MFEPLSGDTPTNYCSLPEITFNAKNPLLAVPKGRYMSVCDGAS
jgi:hypothetical protein